MNQEGSWVHDFYDLKLWACDEDFSPNGNPPSGVNRAVFEGVIHGEPLGIRIEGYRSKYTLGILLEVKGKSKRIG